jgi:hypothetical protein
VAVNLAALLDAWSKQRWRLLEPLAREREERLMWVRVGKNTVCDALPLSLVALLATIYILPQKQKLNYLLFL